MQVHKAALVIIDADVDHQAFGEPGHRILEDDVVAARPDREGDEGRLAGHLDAVDADPGPGLTGDAEATKTLDHRRGRDRR